jgi:hypothetical protein
MQAASDGEDGGRKDGKVLIGMLGKIEKVRVIKWN